MVSQEISEINAVAFETALKHGPWLQISLGNLHYSVSVKYAHPRVCQSRGAACNGDFWRFESLATSTGHLLKSLPAASNRAASSIR